MPNASHLLRLSLSLSLFFYLFLVLALIQYECDFIACVRDENAFSQYSSRNRRQSGKTVILRPKHAGAIAAAATADAVLHGNR